MSMVFFYIGFGFLAVAVLAVTFMVRRLEQRVEAMAQYLELFSQATITHVMDLRKATDTLDVKEDVTA